MRLLLLIFYVGVFAVPLFAQTETSKSSRKEEKESSQTKKGVTRALVIGISSYQQISPLNFADDDASEFASFLLTNPRFKVEAENLTLLVNEHAKAGNIVSELSRLLEVSKEGDQLYFYFSGHGDVETTEESNQGFLLAYDTPKNNYATGGISVSLLQQVFASLTEKGVKLFLVTDACRAGHLAGGIAGAKHTAKAFSSQWKNEIKVLSAQPDELSFESEKWGDGRGVFSFFFVKGMSGFADFNNDSVITLSELEQYVGLQVSEATQYKQQPVFQGPQKFSNAISYSNKSLMERYAKWNSDAQITVATIKGENEGKATNCIAYNKLLETLEKPFLDSLNFLWVLNSYRQIGLCSRDLQEKAKYKISASLMNDIQNVVNESLIGKNLVVLDEIKFARVKLDSLFALNKNLIYRTHFENLNVYLNTLRATHMGREWAKVEDVNNYIIPSLRKALKEENNPAYINYAIGVANAHGLHQFDSAIYYYKEAVRRSPTWLMPRLLLGIAYGQKRETDSAIVWYESVLALDSAFRNFECLVCFNSNLAELYLEQGEYKLSEKYYKAVLDFDSTNTAAMYGLFYLNKRLKNKQESAKWLLKFDRFTTDIEEKLEAAEYLIDGKLISKNDAKERIAALRTVVSNYITESDDIEINRINYLETYLKFLELVYDYRFGFTHVDKISQIDDRWADSSPDPKQSKLKLLRLQFSKEQTPELLELIKDAKERWGNEYSYDELNELNFMYALTVLSLNRKKEGKPGEDRSEVLQAISTVNELHEKGFFDCNFLNQLRRYLKVEEEKLLTVCK